MPRRRGGKFTYISGHGNSVIDYCITSVDFVKHVKRLCVQNRVESPHMPVEVTIACSFRAEHEETKDIVSIQKYVWQNEESEAFLQHIESDGLVARFKEACDLIDIDINAALKIITDSILEAGSCMRKTVKIKRVQGSQWYDRECAEKKKAARRALRRYRKTNKDDDKQTYFEQRKEYKALLQSKQKQFKQDRVNKLESSMKDSRDFWGEIRDYTRQHFYGKLARPFFLNF